MTEEKRVQRSGKKSFISKVPGFRSGKWWKKIIASIGYFFLLLIIIGALSSGQKNANNEVADVHSSAESETRLDVKTEPGIKNEESEEVLHAEKLLTFEGYLSLHPKEGSVRMLIASNVPDGGIFEIALLNENLDVVSDFVEIKDSLIEKTFEVPDWEPGHISGMATFRFNLDDHPQPDYIKEIYGEIGEKMCGDQALETTIGGYNGNIEPVTIAYPSEAAVQEKVDKLFVDAMQDVIKISDGVIKKIKPVDSWQLIYVTVNDNWYFSPDYEKERFAETVSSTIETLVRNAGKVGKDQVVSVYFYDAYGKELASPKLLGGYKIKR